MRKLPLFIVMAIITFSLSAWNLKEKYKGPKYQVTDVSWHPDILEGYEARYVNQGRPSTVPASPR